MLDVWTPAVRIAPEEEDPRWSLNDVDSTTAVFDVAPLGGSGLAVAWVEPHDDSELNEVRFFLAMRLYREGLWEERRVLDDGKFSGVHLVAGSDGVLHLFDWARQEFLSFSGPLEHRSSVDGVTWTSPRILDRSGGAAFASAAAGPDGRLDVVWDRSDGGKVIWRRLTAGHWEPPRVIARGAEKPTATSRPDGSVVFLWSILRPASTGIGSLRVSDPP